MLDQSIKGKNAKTLGGKRQPQLISQMLARRTRVVAVSLLLTLLITLYVLIGDPIGHTVSKINHFRDENGHSKEATKGSQAVKSPKNYFDDEKDTMEVPSREELQTFNAKIEIMNLIKKAPIIIFSKTYCGYSKLVKHIFLEEYMIEPSPLVVELDMHKHGDLLQKELRRLSNIATVPNVLIAGTSIGGWTEINDLIQKNEFESVLRKQIQNLKIRETIDA